MPLTESLARRSDRDRMSKLHLLGEDVVRGGSDREDSQLNVLQRQF